MAKAGGIVFSGCACRSTLVWLIDFLNWIYREKNNYHVFKGDKMYLSIYTTDFTDVTPVLYVDTRKLIV